MRVRSVLLAAAAAVGLAAAARAGGLPGKYLAVKDIKRGLTGYGLSVFRGTKIERFEVEVLGVLRNRMPKQDMILARMKGAGLEHTGIIGGMSGSPIYLKVGEAFKLAGAIAYGWSFPKEPICGITPFENMYGVLTATGTKPKMAAAPDGKLDEPIVLAHRTITSVRIASTPPTWDALPSSPAVLYRLRTPLYVGGLPDSMMAMVRKEFGPYDLWPVQGGGASRDPGLAKLKLEPGAALAIIMAEGDVSMSGVGTVTEVIGDTVLGFGHPMFAEGRVSVPMATAVVQFCFPSLIRSFKLSSPIKTVGSLTADMQAAVMGKLGKTARMIPIEARLRRSDMQGEQAFHCRAFDHPRLTSRIVAMFFMSCLVGRGNFPRENTVAYRATIELKGHKPLVYQNVYSGLSSGSAISKAFNEIVQPMATLANNPLGRVQIEKVTAQFQVAGEETTALVESVRLERNEYRAGDTLRAIATIRPFKKPPVVQTLELKLPDDLPAGLNSVVVCDAATSHTRDKANAPSRYVARDVEGLVRVLRHQSYARRLFIRMKLPGRGIAYKGSELPALPASMFNVVVGPQKITGLTPTSDALTAHVDLPYVVAGNHVLPVLIRPKAVD